MNTNKMKQLYSLSKTAKVGETCKCPSCGNSFTKTSYQQAFCKSQFGTQCKDKFWNTITPNKKNNTTRISKASKLWSSNKPRYTSEGYRIIEGVAYNEFDEPMYNL